MKDLFFETKEFSISADRYIKSVMLKVFAHWWWMPTLLVFVSAFLAMTMSIKFLYVAIIVLFMMTSLLLVFVYVYYSSTQEARIAILQKVITINNEGIKIEFSPIKKLNYEEKSNDIEETPTEYFTPKSCFISRSEVYNIENMGSYVSIQLKGGKYRFIIIPFCEINGDVNDFLAYILQYCDIKD